jgi:hypothetical protein
MKNKWINTMLILLFVSGTFWVLKYGVKMAVDMSALSPHPHSTDKDGANQSGDTSKTNPDGSAISANGNGANGSINGAATGTAGSSSTSAQNSAGGVNGTAGHSGAGEIAKATPTPKPDSNCFTFDYQHKKEARQKDIEDFLDYTNAFALLHKNVNEKSICVKVNQKPVAFKVVHSKSTDEVVIGSVVGPESVIHVAYCVNKANCTEACAIKTNRLMDDLMSDAGDDEEFKDSWGDTDDAHKKDQKKELKSRVKELRAVASENKDLEKNSVMRVWENLDQKEWVCKKQ